MTGIGLSIDLGGGGTPAGGGGGGFSPSLNYSDARNSMYYFFLFGW